jgi:sugar/nucleoside kinase (ribokinase family)
MALQSSYYEIDYLLIGHITKDLTPSGPRLGGTVTFASLTASRLGLRVGIVSSWGPDISLEPLRDIPLAGFPDDQTTTYENIETPVGRVQTIHSIAASLDYHHIPDAWRSAPITHIAPLNQEVRPSLISRIQSDGIFLTPQGWLREWDEQGRIQTSDWPDSAYVLSNATGAVISAEDLEHSESRIEEMASASRLLVITEGKAGARVFFQGEVRHFNPPEVNPIDTTGAGDIFATVFFIHFFRTQDPWEAGHLATTLAAQSTLRRGIQGIPTRQEIEAATARITER